MELWSPIVGYPDYEVSSLGRVASSRKGSRRLLSPGTSKAGYRVIVLYDRSGGRKSHNVHRLVGEYFLPDWNSDLEVNHKRGAIEGDALDNLEMMTTQQNLQHSFDHLGRIGGGSGLKGALSSTSRKYTITHPNGLTEEIIGLAEFCRTHSLDRHCMSLVANGKQKQHRGFKVRKV